MYRGSRSPENNGSYSHLNDCEVVRLAKQGDNEALKAIIDRYKNFVRIKARSYFLIGADKEDIVQEGMIGLYKAVRDFREEKYVMFKAFAELCVTRQMITAIKTATRQKHTPLNSYISLNNPVGLSDEPERDLVDILASGEALDPMDLVISGEEAQSMRSSFGRILSDLEADVLRLYMDGRSYQEIAEILDRHVKSIDNALQRIKRKVEQYLRYREGLAQGMESRSRNRVRRQAS